jgi:Phosphopantetheine attachment site
LDSLMGVEIENSIESAIGVALPPASLLRARTIGQIVGLIAEHMGAKRPGGAAAPPARAPAATDEVNLEALSDEEISGLLGDDAAADGATEPENAVG